MRPSALVHRYRWRVAIILGFPAAGITVGFLIKVAVVAPALAAAAIAGVFAWGQWHTARQKLILDLFDRRYRLYAEYKALLMQFAERAHPDMSDDLRLRLLTSEMKPLFGDEVINSMKLLTERYHTFCAARLGLFAGSLGSRTTDRETVDEAKSNYDHTIGEIHRLVLPYLRMDQKLPRPPSEWPVAFSAWLKRKWDERPTGE